MDVFLGKVTQHAMNYAIRSGIGLTASFAIRQSSKLLSNTPKSVYRDEFDALQQRLAHKIQIVSPAIDMIELIAARGNTSLESAVALTKELRLEIQSLAQRISAVNASAEAAKKGAPNSQLAARNELELKLLNSDTKKLLERIEDAVPLINLAITTSGASLSTSLPHTVSPSRLLQASTFLTAGDTQYSMHPSQAVQIGPTFTLTIYMLFAGHDRPQNEEDIRETTWKEVIHKARVKLRRVPLALVLQSGTGNSPITRGTSPSLLQRPSSIKTIPAAGSADEYAYQLMIIEDLDDDRYHDFGENGDGPVPFDDVNLAGIRETLPVHEISKIFYADTSKVLNIGSDAESNHPVLLLKRDLDAVPPRNMAKADTPGVWEGGQHHPGQEDVDTRATRNTRQDPWRFPPSLDPEWIAFEVYAESEASDSESETGEQEATGTNTTAVNSASPSNLANSLSHLHLTSSPSSPSANAGMATDTIPLPTSHQPPWANQIRTSLSLLELLLRLTSLQQFQQQSHLCITDELLNFFLEESASTGAGGDEQYRQALRADARRRVGWDPYDESPVKRRGEEYLDRYAGASSAYGDATSEQFTPRSTPASARGTPVESSTFKSANATRRSKPSGGAWSPRSESYALMQDFADSPSPRPSPSPIPTTTEPKTRTRSGRRSWLKRDEDRSAKGSPLRPSTALTDEGIGTSPVSNGGDEPSNAHQSADRSRDSRNENVGKRDV